MSDNKTIAGLKWSFIDNIAQQSINFIVGIILARILLPAEFGLLGIITVFIAISITLMDGGLNDAIINKEDATNEDYNTVFWSNLLFSLIVYLLLFISAPYIAIFFEEDSLILLLRIGGLNVFFMAASSIQRSIFIKNINFKSISLISLVSVIISGVVAIIMALYGFGVLSLVVRVILGQLATTIIFYIISKWRPAFVFKIESFKSLYKYGINLFFSRLLNTIQNNIYPFIIGKIYNPVQLGYYTRADSFKSLASTNISNTIQRVSFPILSNIKDKNIQVETFNKFMSLTLIITSLCMTILYVNSKSIVLILIGDRWIDVIPYLQILAISGLFIPLYNMNLNFLAVIKKTNIFLVVEILSKILLVPTIIIGIVTSIEIFLWTIVSYSIVIYVISFFTVKQFLYRGALNQIYALLKMSIPILLSFFCAFFSEKIENIWGELLVNLLLISGLFLLSIYLFFNSIYESIHKQMKS